MTTNCGKEREDITLKLLKIYITYLIGELPTLKTHQKLEKWHFNILTTT